MFGILGALAYAVTYMGAWLKAETDEQYKRNRAKDKDIPLYFDKYGNMRHTDTGRKYTSEEFIRNQKIRDQKIKDDYERRMKYLLRTKYYIVWHDEILFDEKYNRYRLGSTTAEVFKTEEAAYAYSKKIKEEYAQHGISIADVTHCGVPQNCSEGGLDSCKQYFNVHLNFSIDD